ncbi:ComF family protein [Yoonia ponticola]|nr:double zinc ribbon domain-containing protein [Yoonia ponticola]
MQSVVRAIYPPQCVACETLTEAEHGLCGPCWAQTAFISGLVCDTCGALQMGTDEGERVQCDECMTIARPWDQGRAALEYKGIGRRLVLGLKHGDRLDLTWPAAGWMAVRAAALVKENTVIVPVPLHWSRLVKRRYNQAAALAVDLGKHLKRPVFVDALVRLERTKPLDGVGRAARFDMLSGKIQPHPKRSAALRDKSVLIVDDVMTSGATLAAAAEAARMAGAANVSIVTLARVVKDT